jgi:uncharacterized membrane protein
MNWYNLVKFLHVASVIVCVGGLFARQLVRQLAKKANDVHQFTSFSQAAGKIESIMVIPGMAAILIFGVILGFIGNFPILGFIQGAQQNWLLVSIILLIGTQVIIPTVFIPRGKKFEPLLQDALAKGVITPELRNAMNDNIVNLAHRYEEVALVIITALMVFKPF